MIRPEGGLSVPKSQSFLEEGHVVYSYTVFNELRAEGSLCDAVITVDGVEFNAHKNVLCVCSSYFRTLFTRCSIPGKRLYRIPGVSLDMMGLIIDYAYTGLVSVTPENVQAVLAAAAQFSVMGVVQACFNFLEAGLCPEKCVGIWMLTDTINSPDLRRKAQLYILRHFEDVVRVSEEFPELSLPQLADFIQRDDLNARREEVVFEAVIRWVQHSAEERSAHLPLLLSNVRMALMPYDYFIHHVKNNALVEASGDCEAILGAALMAMYRRHLNLPSTLDVSNPLNRPRLLAGHGELGGREALRRRRRRRRAMRRRM